MRASRRGWGDDSYTDRRRLAPTVQGTRWQLIGLRLLAHCLMPSVQTGLEVIGAFRLNDANSRSYERRLVDVATVGRIHIHADPAPLLALSDLNLRQNHGDWAGLVGHIGAGKTTPLRFLRGIQT